MTAADGQSLWNQSPQTQNDYQAIYGGSAEAQWDADHNAAIGALSASSSGGGGGGGGSGTSDWTDFFTNQAGMEKSAQKLQKQQIGINKDQVKGQIKYWQGQIKNQANQIAVEKGRAAADKWYQEREVELALLQHQIALGQLGESYIKDAVEYASTPDNYWKLLDFQAGASQRQDVPLALQALAGQTQIPAFQEHGGSPTMKSPGDLLSLLGYQGQITGNHSDLPFQSAPSALASLGGAATQAGSKSPVLNNAPGGVPSSGLGGGVSVTGASVGAGTMGDAGTTGGRALTAAAAGPTTQPGSKSPVLYNAPGAEGAMGDARQAAAMGVVQNMPPSSGQGWNNQDIAAINQIMQTYASPQDIPAGQWEATPTDAKKMFLAGVSRGGGSPSDFIDNWWNTRINQGSANAA